VSVERRNTGRLLPLALMTLLVVSVVYSPYHFLAGLGKP
jgi:hypothetical protein